MLCTSTRVQLQASAACYSSSEALWLTVTLILRMVAGSAQCRRLALVQCTQAQACYCCML